jgi:hypothetical protein
VRKNRRIVTSDPEEIARRNEGFREDVEKYGLVYRCDSCIHVRGAEQTCLFNYPNEMLVRGEVRALDENGEWVFCKDFQLQDG